MAYITPAQLKAYLKIATAAEDDLLATMTARAQAMIEGATQKVFEITAPTVKYFDAQEDVDEGRELSFGRLWCAEITAVTNGNGATIPAADYVTLPRNQTPIFGLRLKTSASEIWTFQDTPEEAIAITGYWGWSKTPPGEIVAAALRLAAFLYRQKDSGLDADRVSTTPDGVTLAPASLPSDVREILAPYLVKI